MACLRLIVTHVKTCLATTTAAILLVIAVAAAPAVDTHGVFVASAAVPATPSTGFVGRSGSTLTLNGQPWRFVGFNNYQLTSQPGGAFYCERAIDQTTLNSILQDVENSVASVIRSWFFQSYYDVNASGQSITPSWSAFDRVLSAAAAHGLKVIPVSQQAQPRRSGSPEPWSASSSCQSAGRADRRAPRRAGRLLGRYQPGRGDGRRGGQLAVCGAATADEQAAEGDRGE